MIHLFGAAVLQSMKPEQPREGVFPTEIYEMITDGVDYETHKACREVSRKFRHSSLDIGSNHKRSGHQKPTGHLGERLH